MVGKRYKIGLALSGGGAKGFAHCGALLALEEFDLRPEIISGTSAGAIAGAIYCAGGDPFSIAEAFIGKEFSHFVRFGLPQMGLFDHEPLYNFIQHNTQGKGFEELDIPMRVVASNFDRGESVVFESGDLSRCILASASVPIVFNPVEIDGVQYVDGGLFKNFPVSPIRDLCEVVIGVNVDPKVANDYNLNLLNVAIRSFHFMATLNAKEDIPLCDILIELEEAHQYTMFDLDNINTIFRLGYTKTIEQLERVYNLERKHPSRLRDLIAPEGEEDKKLNKRIIERIQNFVSARIEEKRSTPED